MKHGLKTAALAAIAVLVAGAALASAGDKLEIGGATYTKFLWGTNRYDGSVYNFTTVPGEGFGDNGQGSEVELFLKAKVSKEVEVNARLHSRFNQNQWTNFGGFGGRNDITKGCVSGDCGENDARSNQYVKLRGVAVTLTPGYKWIDSATIGANDFGQFDPFVIGRIRYIDRDNAAGLLFQGSAAKRKLTWDAVRISLPRLWAGPSFNTGTSFKAGDAAYGFQAKVTPGPQVDVGGILEWVNDEEIDAKDLNLDNGRDLVFRFRNTVVGGKVGIHPNSKLDVRAALYHSNSKTNDDFAPKSFGLVGYSPVLAGKHEDNIYKANFDLNDPFEMGLSFNVEAFSIGSDYVSMMASRREADVLLTEGYDAAFAFPGPNNTKFGVFGSRTDPNADGFNRSVIGYGGWEGNAVQVATFNVDNEFTDFIEPLAETAIGWKGVTITPVISKGALDLAGEYTHLGYNTNWQAYGDPSRSITDTPYPTHESDAGVLHNFRSAYAPFQDKKTDIFVAKFKYLAEVGKGVELFGKFKHINETDKRMNDPRFLPYTASGEKNFYSDGNTTSDVYTAPSIITNSKGESGYQWKPFDSISDDDRDLSYSMFQVGATYQLTGDLQTTAMYEYFNADLIDGNTAFQAYNLHEMASGKHHKNRFSLKGRYILAGMEFGFVYEIAKGNFEPDFGGGFVVQYADDKIASEHNVPVGSPGFSGRYGGWNSLETRNFTQQRIHAFMKIVF